MDQGRASGAQRPGCGRRWGAVLAGPTNGTAALITRSQLPQADVLGVWPPVSPVGDSAGGARAYRGRMLGHVPSVSAMLANGKLTSTGDVIATTRVGCSTTVEVVITGPASTHVVRGGVIVAVPGSASGAGALRPKNWLAEGDPAIDTIAHGQHLTVTFQPTEPGEYPVFFIAQIRFSEESARDEHDRRLRRSCQELGSIIVR